MSVTEPTLRFMSRFGWLILGINALMAGVLRVSGPELPARYPVVPIIYFAVLIGYLIIHLIMRLGLRNLPLFFGLAFGISYGFEVLGVTQGWLFGEYHYTEFLGFQLPGGVPLAVPLAWVLMLYCVLLAAELLVYGSRGAVSKTTTKWVRYLIVPNLAAGLMTMWDLVMDPRAVQNQAWVWEQGGSYYGIPFSNFLGWYGTSLVIIVLYLLCERRVTAPRFETLPFWYNFPVLGYHLAVLNNVTEGFRLGLVEAATVMTCFWIILTLLFAGALGRR